MNSDSTIQTDQTNLAPKKHGGGPKTPEGKAIARMNSLKHGMYAIKLPILRTESPEAFQEHLSAYYARYSPVDQVEKDLVYELASIQWSLNRISALEVLTIDSQMDSLHFSHFTPDAAGIADLTVKAVSQALQGSVLHHCHRRYNALVRARSATLKALSHLRRDHPKIDPDPAFLPDPLHYPFDDPEPSPGDARGAAVSSGDIRSAEGAECVPPTTTEPTLLLPPFPQTLIQNLSKRTLPNPPAPLPPVARRPSIA